ncbi:immunoglobulin-like domain-containing protein [Listeria seeligeri]|uniref:LPXTG cell wall anchor domain-containing protein n=1 Tax=Listeria seeligeri TaxID=1640 RepID=UPI0010B19F1D|nr:immunoglobulin-like domain-containing protein [Listeria seeligeri]
MKKIITLLATVALASIVVFNFIPGIVASAANTSESNLTYKDVKSGFYFVGYENVQLEKGKSYKYTVAYEANVDMTMNNTITGQNAKAGLFTPKSSGAELNSNYVTRTNGNVTDVADANRKVFTHTFEFTAKENTKADIGVFLTPGSVLPNAPDSTLIWKSVSVVDETPAEQPEAPVISATDKTIKQDDSFNPLDEVTATDKKDGDITKDVKVTKNTVDTSKAGVYDVDYSVTNSSNLTTAKSIKVTVEAGDAKVNTAPVINAKDQTIKVGDAFNALKDVTATDKEDGDLTAKIKITKDTVNNSEKGVYQVTYTVTDSGNLSATLTIKVTVTQDGKIIINPTDPTDPTNPTNPSEPIVPKKPNDDPTNVKKVSKTADVKTAKIPKTGDDSMIWIVLSGLGLVAIGLTTYRKKSTR